MAAKISHHFPSFGHPFDLTIQQFFSLYDRIVDIYEMQSPNRDHRSYVEKMKRRMALDN